jgi:endonuclease G
MDDFNQSSKNGVWGRLEEAVFADADVQDLRISVFGGPVFQDNDRQYRGVQLPREYWKILAYVEQGVLRSNAFLLTQNLNPFEALDVDEFRAFQVSTAELEQRTLLRFADALRDPDAFAPLPPVGDREPLNGTADIQW